MSYLLGCCMQIDARKDEWFVQIVEGGVPARGFFSVAASGTAIGRDEALAKVCGFVGLKDVPPVAMRGERTPVDVVQIGLLDVMRRCAQAIDGLAETIVAHRPVADDQYEFDLY